MKHAGSRSGQKMMDELLVIGRGEMPRKGGGNCYSFTPPNVEEERERERTLIQKTASFRAFVSTKSRSWKGRTDTPSLENVVEERFSSATVFDRYNCCWKSAFRSY